MRRVAVLGATGSIGASALDVIARHPDRFEATVLSANTRVDELAALCHRFKPRRAIIADPARLADLKAALSDLDCIAEAGPEALEAAAGDTETDTVLAAIVGAAGMRSTLAAARTGKRLLLANKESVVVAGALLMREVADNGAEILPIDSEHNAIFQCLPSPQAVADAHSGVERIVLTASGGPFRGWSRERLGVVTPEQACAHPNWDMGRKISVDSATLMNKGLEVIEAHWLFAARPEQIEVVVHPQSIVHSLVGYRDGSLLAQLGQPDMRTALAYGLGWPERIDAGVRALDMATLGSLDFGPPDRHAFPCLDLAYSALEQGGGAPTILNAANEVAVSAFLQRQLGFLSIPEVIAATLDAGLDGDSDSLEGLIALDAAARREAELQAARRH
ncbi:MAG: 1-deoxy-D-xylulose-5-phosphate reductoisomerase [Lysobacteraceae bacterium]|nr:1-deoxy-D-xylulose-5-phosphate reductoisomerase [Xanthomonadaceae bacterium]HRX99631.1 1-deoxy-D-xylulose-5-phosphate reductoisomerase [Xanthomonadaceae bacterium]